MPPAQATGPIVGSNNYGGTLDSNADGVQGYAASTNAGIFGRNNDLNGTAVYGAAPNGTGVFGESLAGTAVGGRSGSKHGVLGESNTGYGVGARSVSAYGLYAQSQSSAGIFTTSTGGAALHAEATSGNIGIYGVSPNGHAILGYGINSGSYAGYFGGRVTVAGDLTVTGNLTVAGSANKSAAVPHSDGSLRRLYCVESPESWFEDFGRAQLSSGRAQVSLDKDFADLVKTDGYHVFPIPEGDCKGLYVSGKSSSGFEVRELQGGTSSISFSYRIIAKRKDIPGPRLEKVQPPHILREDELPKPPAEFRAGVQSAQPQQTATPAPTNTTVPTSAAPTITPAPSPTSTPTAATSTPTALPTRTSTPGATGSPAAN